MEVSTIVEPAQGASADTLGESAARAVARARAAQPGWAHLPIRRRLRVLRRLRHRIAGHSRELADTVALPQRRNRAETLPAEILPLLDACRFLEREAPKILAPQRLGRRRRPLWHAGTAVEVLREAHGVVLVIAPSNYPLLLPGVQLLQALAAGNAVVVKPGVEAGAASAALARELDAAGLPEGLLQVLGEEVDEAVGAIDAGVDMVVLTGSSAAGRAVLERLADTATPAIMELSGCDAVIVRRDADLELTAEALRFGLTLNGSFTCMAPRRILVDRSRMEALEHSISSRLAAEAPIPLRPGLRRQIAALVGEAVAGGARVLVGEVPTTDEMAPLALTEVPPDASILNEDLPAPLFSLVATESDEQAIALVNGCRYRLGATVFGSPAAADAIARRLDVGFVVVNDMIAPTADPRAAFGGRGASGFGVTRGVEGLLQMTTPKTVFKRGGRFRPHYDPVGPIEEELFERYIALAHSGSAAVRFDAAAGLVRAGHRLGRERARATKEKRS